jgi:hypothetical protein
VVAPITSYTSTGTRRAFRGAKRHLGFSFAASRRTVLFAFRPTRGGFEHLGSRHRTMHLEAVAWCLLSFISLRRWRERPLSDCFCKGTAPVRQPTVAIPDHTLIFANSHKAVYIIHIDLLTGHANRIFRLPLVGTLRRMTPPTLLGDFFVFSVELRFHKSAVIFMMNWRDETYVLLDSPSLLTVRFLDDSSLLKVLICFSDPPRTSPRPPSCNLRGIGLAMPTTHRPARIQLSQLQAHPTLAGLLGSRLLG